MVSNLLELYSFGNRVGIRIMPTKQYRYGTRLLNPLKRGAVPDQANAADRNEGDHDPLLEASSPHRTDNANTSLSGNTLRFRYTPLTRSLNFSRAQGTILLSSF